MSVGPQLQLAVLWPWLLMATLQIRLGYSGLALAAVVEADRSLAQKAIIRVTPFKLEPLMLEGVFASIADVTPAEGNLLQFHPLSLCNTSEDEHTFSGFVSIIKLERPERDLHPCLSLANKAKLAGERGARAVLFDITDDQGAADQLSDSSFSTCATKIQKRAAGRLEEAQITVTDQDPSALPLRPREDVHQPRPGQRPHFFRQHPGRALYHFPQTLPPAAPRNCPEHPFLHSPQLSQSGIGTMHYLRYGPVGSETWCPHQPPRVQRLLVSQPQESRLCEQAAHRPFLLQRQPPCRGGLRAPLSDKLNRAGPPNRGIRHGRHHHHNSGSGESYLTEPSGYLPDGPGSDTSSGPCHGSSSDSMLNCTDVSLQAIHGSCSTFHSSLSSDYDPFAFCGSDKPATESGQEPSPSWREPRPRLQSVDMAGKGRAQLASNHVHYHHHHHRHHHYGRSPPDYLSGRLSHEPIQRKAKYPRAKAGLLSAQVHKRTEKVHLRESGSDSQEATLLGQPSCLPQRHAPSLPDRLDFRAEASGQAGAMGSQTSPQPFLQLHPSRRKWKHPLVSSQFPLPEDSSVPPDCSAPTRCGHSSANCCPTEMQPLVPSGSSVHTFSDCQQVSKCLAPHSDSRPREQGNRTVEQDCESVLLAEGSGMDTTGNYASVYLSCQIPQPHQGSKEDVPDIYEHSV
ncbi:E3 ubiquitin-protein ligase RNF43 [Sphaerodactylus townsendi]|uniref:E3 ubiquitin-protein ligase RNF43 n=1 Tax=Sphaerodactylus townsendi TaxID=933632 RepID=UPI00202682AB|nr:E3 ubiquitin-protein ligase RNF43 [Sphaerodactylus townsendi]